MARRAYYDPETALGGLSVRLALLLRQYGYLEAAMYAADIVRELGPGARQLVDSFSERQMACEAAIGLQSRLSNYSRPGKFRGGASKNASESSTYGGRAGLKTK